MFILELIITWGWFSHLQDVIFLSYKKSSSIMIYEVSIKLISIDNYEYNIQMMYLFACFALIMILSNELIVYWSSKDKKWDSYN